MALNDTRLRNLKPQPGKAERLVADGNGLYIRIRVGEDKTTRTWQFRRRDAGSLSITTLGTYPELPLLEARQQGLELATKGRSYSPTIAVAAEQWLTERIDHTHAHPELIRGYVERGVLPVLGNRRVRDVEPSEIAAVVRGYRDQAGKKAAARKGGLTTARTGLPTIRAGGAPMTFGGPSARVSTGWASLPTSSSGPLTTCLAG